MKAVYVLAIDATTNTVIGQADVQASAGRYVWSIPGVTARSVTVVAGTDYDNDGFICARGEACGAFLVLGNNITPITLTGNRNDLNFLLTPVGAGTAAGASVGGVQNRLPTPIARSQGSTLNLPWSTPPR